MVWPFHFVTLSDSDLVATRRALDRYGVYSQVSILAPILVYLFYRLGSWIAHERFARHSTTNVKYSALPISSVPENSKRTAPGKRKVLIRRAKWWLGTDVSPGWGRRGSWIVSILWAVWLLFLSLHDTQADYKHVTRRFGIVAVAQLPLQYVAGMKWWYSPLTLVFGASHEDVNPYHRALGWIIYIFFLIHAGLYLNFFIQQNSLIEAMWHRAVVTGMFAILALSIMMTTSNAMIRRWNYRVFFIAHLTIGIGIIVVLFLHASHLRVYIAEAAFFIVLDRAGRRTGTLTANATITSISQGELLRVSIPLSEEHSEPFRHLPGAHVYLSIPTAGKLPKLTSNPYSVAAVAPEEINLVFRPLKGPTSRALAALASSSQSTHSLTIEGPYGAARHFPNFATDFDRCLLVAGGIGGTFIFPIYQHIQRSFEQENMPSRPTKLLWVAKSEADVAWASPPGETPFFETDLNVEVFLTGRGGSSAALDRAEGDVEREGLVLDDLAKTQETLAMGRPDLRQHVDEFFERKDEGRVAIIVCGPEGLARDLRDLVGVWVGRGKDVWWHEERF